MNIYNVMTIFVIYVCVYIYIIYYIKFKLTLTLFFGLLNLSSLLLYFLDSSLHVTMWFDSKSNYTWKLVDSSTLKLCHASIWNIHTFYWIFVYAFLLNMNFLVVFFMDIILKLFFPLWNYVVNMEVTHSIN